MDQELIAYLDRRFGETSQQISTLREDIGTLREETHQRFEQVDRRLDKGEETARHTLILLEDLRSEVHLIAEGVVGLNQRLDRFQRDDDFMFNRLRGWFEPYFRHLDDRAQILEERAELQRGTVMDAIRKLVAKYPVQRSSSD